MLIERFMGSIHATLCTASCDGQVACSTCHIILPPEHYAQLTPPKEDENDMLELAHGLTDTYVPKLGVTYESYMTLTFAIVLDWLVK